MASIKAKKGNPFEYNTQYSLLEGNYPCVRMDDNSEGIDLYIDYENGKQFIECKRHKGFTWNELVKTYEKTKKTVDGPETVYLIFKGNRQPTLVFYRHFYRHDEVGHYTVKLFEEVFGCEWKKRPKGWKIYNKR